MVTSLAPRSIEWPKSEQWIDGAALDAEQVEVLVHTETPDDHEAIWEVDRLGLWS